MTEDEEIAYGQGMQACARLILGEVLRHCNDNDRDAESWRIERMDLVAKLRDVCGEFGDNDWDDDLYLADVVEKHLRSYLKEEMDE